MINLLRYPVLVTLLFFSMTSFARSTSPEALVVMVYVSAHRCEAQHPKLKKNLKAAYAAWAKRNKKYVISAKKRMDFREIDNLYKARRRHDKPIPLATCESYARRLLNPANDIRQSHANEKKRE